MTQDANRRVSRLRVQDPVEAEESLTSFPEPPTSPTLSHRSVAKHDALDSLLDQAGQPSMFDVTPSEDQITPQNLSASPQWVIENVVDRYGAPQLVQRLATALAERDAHISALQRLCEEFKIPQARIEQTVQRASQAEQRRLALAEAVAEENKNHQEIPRQSLLRTRTGSSQRSSSAVSQSGGLTKLFGGARKQRLSVHSASASVRSSSQSSRPTDSRPRAQSTSRRSADERSMDARSGDSARWLPALFTNATARPQPESKPSRVPVELQTQIDPAQLPPTLLRNPRVPQEFEWNRFVLKLMKAREQNGEPEEDGVLIGAARFGREGSLGRAKMETLNKLLIGGVPNLLRHRVWMELSNAHAISQPDAYQHYLRTGNEKTDLDIDAIKKDVPRTLTQQYDYYIDKGYEKLKNLLVAFIAKYEDLGYTQGLNMIAGHLLLAIPAEEDAFWMLCNIVDNFFPKDYFSRSTHLTGPLADNMVLRGYIKEMMPKLSDCFDAIEILPQNTMRLGWILTAFSDMLPKELLQRVWDVWLCMPKQHTFLFNAALALLKLNMDELLLLGDEEQFHAFSLQLPETPAEIDDFIRLAVSMRKRMDQHQITERRKVEMRRLRNPSTEALYSPD